MVLSKKGVNYVTSRARQYRAFQARAGASRCNNPNFEPSNRVSRNRPRANRVQAKDLGRMLINCQIQNAINLERHAYLFQHIPGVMTKKKVIRAFCVPGAAGARSSRQLTERIPAFLLL
jgi:hypothetical protein